MSRINARILRGPSLRKLDSEPLPPTRDIETIVVAGAIIGPEEKHQDECLRRTIGAGSGG